MNTFTQIFNNCQNDTEIKKAYRQAAKQNHPDHGGSNEKMQLLNEAYEMALKGIDKQEFDGRTYYYNEAKERETMEKLSEALAVVLSEHAEIHLMGTWLWALNTEKSDKDLLNRKGLGFKWHSVKKAWYWKPSGSRSRGRGKTSFEDIANKYGVKVHKAKKAVILPA